MMNLNQMTTDQQRAEYNRLRAQYDAFCAEGHHLDMSRGRPDTDQLNLSDAMMQPFDPVAPNGIDCRNYGMPDGVRELADLFAGMLDVPSDWVILGGASSLNMMFDKISDAMTHGICGHTPWCRQAPVKFLCPVPGYDRHFTVCEYFGIEMIPVAMTPTGPDMDAVERLVASDAQIKGIWCVPKYSNPQGYTYSDETVRRFAQLNPAAPDFRIYWDNAYCVHDLTDTPDQLLSLYEACVEAGHPDLPVMFASTSKITYPGAGVSAIAESPANAADDKKRLFVQMVCGDKMNMLRHLYFLKDMDGVRAQMKRHAALLRPKFEAVCRRLRTEFVNGDLLTWYEPHGGYFLGVDTLPGCAKRVVALCAQAGVKLTGAGATYPYGKDPQDRNIRLAPSGVKIDELEQAMALFCLCVKLASLEKVLKIEKNA